MGGGAVSLPSDLADAIERVAADRGTTASAVLDDVLNRALDAEAK